MIPKPIPGEECSLLFLILAVGWIAPIAFWVSLFRKLSGISVSCNDSNIEHVLESWKFTRMAIEQQAASPSLLYYFRSSNTINSSRKPSLILFIIGPSFYCNTLGPPAERLRHVLCTFIEDIPNASIIITQSDWIKSDELLSSLFSSFEEDHIYKYASDHLVGERFSIKNIVFEIEGKSACRLCLPASSKTLSLKQIISLLASIVIRRITMGWPYRCNIYSDSQLFYQISHEFKPFYSEATLQTFLELAERQASIFFDLLKAIKCVLLRLIQNLVRVMITCK